MKENYFQRREAGKDGEEILSHFYRILFRSMFSSCLSQYLKLQLSGQTHLYTLELIRDRQEADKHKLKG